MAKRIVLVRHGAIGVEYAGCMLGSTDAPLSELGRRQTQALAPIFEALSPSAVLASPLVRAAESARCAGLDPHIDADLRETDFGEWEQKSFEEAAESAPPGLIDKWAVFDHDFRFPQGERLGDFLERVAGATDRLAAINAETVVVMTHGGVIRTMICHLLGIDPRHYLLFNVDHASITTLSIHQGRGVLAELNDTCHLKGVS